MTATYQTNHSSNITMSPPTYRFGVDRVHLALSEMPSQTMLDALTLHCGKPPQIDRPSDGSNPYIQQTICLFQPSTKALEIVRDELGVNAFDRIAYIELALDILGNHPAASRHWMKQLLGRIWFRRLRGRNYLDHETMYFARRTRKRAPGKRRRTLTDIVPTIYPDRLSKILGVPRHKSCLHIEMRLFGVRAIRAIGISCLDDVIAFDHAAYWVRAIAIYPRPTFTGIGRLLRDPTKGKVSSEMYRRAGGTFMRVIADSIKTSGHEAVPFVFQAAARKCKLLRQRQKPSDIFSWIASLDGDWKPPPKRSKAVLI